MQDNNLNQLQNDFSKLPSLQNVGFLKKAFSKLLIKTHNHTSTHPHPLTDTFPLFCISETTGPIELKFCMHIECEEAIIIHNYTKWIGRRLGYANEGQSSNIPLFCISRTSIPIELKFGVHIQCD